MSTITLITICYNSVKTLRRTLDSVLAQTRRPDTYCFVDGGSTDGTLELLAEMRPVLERAGMRVVVMNQERRPGEAGIPSAWNQGIRGTEGDIIALLNSDDIYAPEALARIESEFEAHPEAGAVVARVRMQERDGSLRYIAEMGNLLTRYWRMPLPHPGFFVRRKTYDAIGLYDTRYRISADYDFVWRCCLAHVTLLPIRDILVTMEQGGFADSTRALARHETIQIARRHAPWSPLPYMAFLLRMLLKR